MAFYFTNKYITMILLVSAASLEGYGICNSTLINLKDKS